MAKTISQIQAMITGKAEPREIINELADYLEANPGGSPGGSSYLVYTANVSQSGTSAPVKNEFKNDFSACTWSRNGVGDYRGDFVDDVTFTTDNIYIPGSFVRFNVATNFYPIYDYATVVGYYRVTPEVNTGHFRLYIEVYDETWTLSDISAVTGGNSNILSLPEIRVYP